ncbi:MAG: hypothetical protein ABEI54_01195, partial [Candidatus Bipolaricaulia bacterium]
MLSCPRCGVSLVAYQRQGVLRCPYCGKHEQLTTCSECGNDSFTFMAGGLEGMADKLRRQFPGARVELLLSD